jgi:hypothetical protein
VPSAVENALAVYSATTAAPHEYFDHTGASSFARSLGRSQSSGRNILFT